MRQLMCPGQGWEVPSGGSKSADLRSWGRWEGIQAKRNSTGAQSGQEGLRQAGPGRALSGAGRVPSSLYQPGTSECHLMG